MFELIGSIFHLLISQPLLNILIVLYKYLPGNDFGLAVIVLTLGVRLVFYPLSQSAIIAQKKLTDLQPKLKQIQERWKNDKERQTRETLALYREAKVNPLVSILPFLVQLPILIALFQLLGKELDAGQLGNLYPFVSSPASLDFHFLGLINLAEPNLGLAFAAGIFQFLQTKMLSPKRESAKKSNSPDFGQVMQKQALYFFPVFTVFILLRLPSALGLYWLATTLFSIGQQYAVLKKEKPKNV